MRGARGVAVVMLVGGAALPALGGCGGRKPEGIRPEASQAARLAPGPPSSLSPAPSALPPAPSAPPPAPSAPPPAPDVVSAALWLVGPKRWAIVHGEAVSLVDPETGAATEIAPRAGLIHLVTTTARGDRIAFTAGESYLGVWGSDGVLAWSVPGVRAAESQAIGLAPGGDLVAMQDEAHLRVWGPGGGPPAVEVEAPGMTLQIVFHADRRHLVLGSVAGVSVLDLVSKTFDGKERGTDTGGTFVTTLSPDGQWTAAGAGGGHALRVWKTLPWSPAATLGEAVDCQNHIGAAFSADGQRLLGNSGEAWRRAFAVGSWRPERPWKPRPDPLLSTTTQLSDDGQTGLRVTDEQIQAVDARSGAVLGTIPHDGWGNQQLSPDGRWLLVYGDGYAIHEARGMRRTSR